MEDAIRQRIKHLLKENRISINKLAGGQSTLQTRLNYQLNGSGTISIDTIEVILMKFPQLSAEWLLRGEGSMFRMPTIIEGGVANGDGATNQYNSKDTIGMFIAEIAEQRKMTQSVIQQNATLLSLLSKKQ